MDDDKLSFQQAVTEFLHPDRIDSEIPIESGTYNKFCPECFYRNGHPLVWCRRCGAQMVVYTAQPIRPTWRNFILRARQEDEAKMRIREFMFRFGVNYRSAKTPEINFDFKWCVYDSDCTTPKFMDAIYSALSKTS